MFEIRQYIDDDSDDYEIVNVAYFDGYSFGDRLLEGVIFEMTLTPAKDDINVKVSTGVDYFNDLNTAKWLQAAKEFALKNDEFSDKTNSKAIYLAKV